ncbi:MAG: hypothetical protein HYU35_00585 [Parcubacteria group bacterium]|nr:hypothetical protein [Parcubacteria group bacterium]
MKGSRKQNILVGALVLAILGLGVYWYLGRTGTPDVAVQSVGVNQTAPQDQFVALLASLSSLKLDTSFFQDPVFDRLVDFGARVSLPSSRGRRNPFAPLQ